MGKAFTSANWIVKPGHDHRSMIAFKASKMLLMLTPPGQVEEFWKEFGKPVADASPPPPLPGSTDRERVWEIARKYGIEFRADKAPL